jgi:hypothetical protein
MTTADEFEELVPYASWKTMDARGFLSPWSKRHILVHFGSDLALCGARVPADAYDVVPDEIRRLQALRVHPR